MPQPGQGGRGEAHQVPVLMYWWCWFHSPFPPRINDLRCTRSQMAGTRALRPCVPSSQPVCGEYEVRRRRRAVMGGAGVVRTGNIEGLQLCQACHRWCQGSGPFDTQAIVCVEC